ncbi:helix-turn-helix transcriptional regulator [Vagococcus silagei]|uniref:Transcriptional regulator n=1 Tax=Vagococcus silagei TaxID=2508885 RepID=A0A4V3TUU4_9ENTE|nr:PAS domain-containing protein [Vagococcus silagei]THB60369.1 hypothetical protein ESZ54_11015 [Vagococcus silagei]
MKKEKLERYKSLTIFLGETLGTNYEIVLHTVDPNGNVEIAAIQNGHITQRKVGGPTSEFAINLIKDKTYENKEYLTSYKAFAKDHTTLKGSTFFIKEEGQLVGLLCINFNPEKYVNLAEDILGLVNLPVSFLQNSPQLIELDNESPVEFFSESIEEIIYSLIDPVLLDDRVTLNPKEKQAIVEELYLKGVFNLKDAVPEVAKILKSSIPTIYRYLKKIQN